MNDEELLSLLQRTTRILQAAAKYYGLESKTAAKARQSVGSQPFHAVVFERLTTLRESIESWKDASLQGSADLAVRQTLDTFEALVRAKGDSRDLQKDSDDHFEGLVLLQAMHRADASSRRRPKPLGFRKYLYCPTADMRQRLQNDVAACANALSQDPGVSGNDSIFSEIETIREWPVPASIRHHATRVRDVLLRRWRCNCGHDHRDVKLAFTALPKNGGISADLEGCYRLYWPASVEMQQQRSMPILHLIKAAESRSDSAVAGAPKPGKKSVRFTNLDPDQNGPREHVAGVRSFSTVCDAINSNHGHCIVRASEDTLHSIHLTTEAALGSASHVQSLRQLLRTGCSYSDLTYRQRIVMALTLAYTYLYLCDTAWWPKDETHPDFWFTGDLSQQRLQAGLPFLAFDVSPPSSSPSSVVEGFINPLRPSLPAFGKLLLEIWNGAPLNWNELEGAVERCKSDPLSTYWLCAVDACCGKEPMLREHQSLHESAPMRSVFVLKVIKSLQWLFEKCVGKSFDQLFPAPDPSMSKIPASNAGLVQPLISKESVASVSASMNALCLHDGSADWEAYDEKNKHAANVWLNQLRDDVHPFIQPCVNPVRVAIIDTGAFFNRRNRMLYDGRVREVRSFVAEQDGEAGVLCPNGEDMDGHGTHATSVFLDVDPFSEVYVAKVFDNRNQKQGTSLEGGLQLGVARAITHAIEKWKVQVISLSFGFERQVEKIRSAILAAESSNIIVLAAASNNGGNKPLSWPARQPTVFNVYATNGYGNSYERNPTQRRHDDNFAVLGSCVNGWWNTGEKVIRSGTSTATPIAAALASLTIHFLWQHKANYARRRNCSTEELDELCQRVSTYPGMRRIFRRMVDPDSGDRDGYCYMEPWLLFDKHLSRETIAETIIAELRQV